MRIPIGVRSFSFTSSKIVTIVIVANTTTDLKLGGIEYSR